MSLETSYRALWSSSESPPDIVRFLNEHQLAEPQQFLAVLRIDQEYRWLSERPLRVEDYLLALPDLPAGIDWKLQLAIGEFAARRDTGRPISEAEISSRFPDLSDTLRDKLLHPDRVSDGSPDDQLTTDVSARRLMRPAPEHPAASIGQFRTRGFASHSYWSGL